MSCLMYCAHLGKGIQLERGGEADQTRDLVRGIVLGIDDYINSQTIAQKVFFA